MKKSILTMLLVAAAYAEGPYQATGFKVGEDVKGKVLIADSVPLK